MKKLSDLLLVLFAAIFFTACSENSSDPPVICTRADGTWTVSLNYGNGLVGHQNWAIAQIDCDLTMTGDPPDLYGPSLGAEPVTGSAYGNSLYAVWVKTYNACRFSSDLDATVTDNSLSGTIYWHENPYGNGYCPSHYGQISVTGSR